ncbi:uncharacterized protein LOC122058265 [Macadamia integrifolia]|uniref:uncharacterized protein LOC122058265 n=1 Tax=Macadamia integrifolia TaxID=60698 RepID=UPI001C52771C|nr:uncharacterized protein LOC122058265 [Macadamia integrifolia]
MENHDVPSDDLSVVFIGEVKIDEEEEEFRSCCAEEEEFRDMEETKNEGQKDDFDEFTVKMFFKGISISGAGESSSGFSGIGVVIEKSHGAPVIQVQKKLDFYVEESVAEYLALMDGLVEALQSNAQRIYAFTDSKIVYDQACIC